MSHPPYKACADCPRLTECQIIGFREGHKQFLGQLRAMCESRLKSETALDFGRLAQALGWVEFTEPESWIPQLIDELPSWQARCILRLRFDKKRLRTLREAASWLGISRKRARDVEWKALQMFRKRVIPPGSEAERRIRTPLELHELNPA